MSLHDKYEGNLEDANEFEDFVSDIMRRDWDFSVHIYRSAKRQFRDGESRGGVEVKLDKRFNGADGNPPTGQLFIETEERHNEQVEFKPAGIHGKAIWYVIGNYGKFWLFACTALKNAEPHCTTKTTATAKGFVLPLDKADKWAARIWDREVANV